ncbi:MAG: cytochrome c [Gemmataceae bacterium]
MKRRAAITIAGAMLALGLWSIAFLRADDEDDAKANKEAQEAVIKLMESMNGNKGNVKSQVQAMHKKFDELKPIMWVYKPRKKGGIGMNKNGEDDIEQMVGKVGNARAKGMNPKKRLDMKTELDRVADISRAVAEVTALYADKYNDDNGKKNPAKWKEFTEKMRAGADELKRAAKGQDAAAIQKAAANFSASCTECHSVFRQ